MVGQVMMPNIYGAVTGGMEDGRVRAAKNALAQAVQQGGPTSPGAMNALSALDPGRAATMTQQQQQFDVSQARSSDEFGQTMGYRDKVFDYNAQRDTMQDQRAQASAGAAAGRQREAQMTAADRANATKGAALLSQVMQVPPERRAAAYQQALQIGRSMGLRVDGLPQEYPGDDAAGMIYSQLSGSVMEQAGAGAAPEYGLNPLMAVAEDGTRVAIQMSKTGEPRVVNVPPGLKLTGQTFRVDTGTNVLNVDSTTGAIISDQPKNVAGAAGEAVLGKAAAEERAGAPRAVAQADTVLADLDALISDPNLENATGWGSYVPFDIPGFNAETRSRMNKVEGQVFMQAFESLKGAGQITEQESKGATQALARLNRAQTPKEFRNALGEFRAIVVSLRERTARRLPDASGGADPNRTLRYNANTGGLE
jgi:hypothetical protein